MNNIGALLCWSWTFLRSVAGYVGVVFVWGGALRGGGWGCLFAVFQGCFAGVGGGRGGIRNFLRFYCDSFELLKRQKK